MKTSSQARELQSRSTSPLYAAARALPAPSPTTVLLLPSLQPHPHLQQKAAEILLQQFQRGAPQDQRWNPLLLGTFLGLCTPPVMLLQLPCSVSQSLSCSFDVCVPQITARESTTANCWPSPSGGSTLSTPDPHRRSWVLRQEMLPEIWDHSVPYEAGMARGWGHLPLVPCWAQRAEDQCCRVGRIWKF